MPSRPVFRPISQTALPSPPDGWHDVAHAVTMDGELAVLRATVDIRAAWRRRRALHETQWKDGTPEAAEIRSPFFPPGTRAHIALPGAPVAEFELEDAFPVFDRMPDGRWAVAGARARYGERNACLLGADGEVQHRFALGDGIEYLQCDAQGEIWIAYFDEGIFSGGEDGLGAAGMARFDSSGAVTWSFHAPEGSRYWIADCYALNVSAAGVWSCTYTDFPILRIERDGEAHFWKNTIAGARALAIESEHVVLLGGYSENMNRLALVRLGQSDVQPAAVFELDMGGEALNQALFVTGRGDTLHIVANGTWYRIAVRELVERSR